jgi:hypothetical protein
VHVQVVDAVTVRQNVTASETEASRLKNRTLDKSVRHRCSVRTPLRRTAFPIRANCRAGSRGGHGTNERLCICDAVVITGATWCVTFEARVP